MWIVNNSQESLSLLAFEAHPDVKEGQPKTAQLFSLQKITKNIEITTENLQKILVRRLKNLLKENIAGYCFFGRHFS